MSGDTSSWSRDQWMRWYDQTLARDERWQEATVHDGDPDFDGLKEWDLSEVADALEDHAGQFGEAGLGQLQTSGEQGVRSAFEALSPEFKGYIHNWISGTGELPESESIVHEIGGWIDGGAPAPSTATNLDPPEPVASEPAHGDMESSALAAGLYGSAEIVDAAEGEEAGQDAQPLEGEPTLPPVPEDRQPPPTDPRYPPGEDWLDDGPEEVDGTVPIAQPWALGEEIESLEGLMEEGGAPEPEEEQGQESIIDELEPAGVLGMRWRRWAIPVVVAGLIVGWVAFGQFGGDDETRAAVQDAIEPSVDTTIDDSAGIGAAVAPTTIGEAADACAPLETHDMELSSADAPGGTVGLEWTRPALRDAGYPSPRFTITGVPENATELAIIASEISEEEADDFLSLPGADPRPLHAFYVLAWTGLEASADVELASFTTGGEPGDTSIRGETMLGGQDLAFVGSDSNGVLLFTVIALCEPPSEYWDPANLVWMEGRIADASMVVYVGG